MTFSTPLAEPIQMPASSTAESEQRAVAMRADRDRPSHLAPAAANRRRGLAALLAVVWCGALGWLALATSNPVTLNRAQIRSADAVVTARIEDRATGRCRVVQQWTGAAVPEEFVVRGLVETAAREEAEWILPLQKSGEWYAVLPCESASNARLVYPATEETIGQLREVVGKDL